MAYITRDTAVQELAELSKKLPTSQDREAAEAALKKLRTLFSGNSFIGSTPDYGRVAAVPR